MSDLKLTAKSSLNGLHKEFDGVTITEMTAMAIMSIAAPRAGEDDLAKAFVVAYGIDLPQTGQSTVSGDANVRLLGLQRDQYFLLIDCDDDNVCRAVELVAQKLGDAGYYTDQSDSWICLRVSGAQSRRALARICPIDLHAKAFAQGALARTVMEHLGTIIVRDGADDFLLFSARSSASSFAHAIETSVLNIL